jgi:hypothetical protein
MKTHGYILVYNPISNEGHLDSWHVLFIQMLRKAGWRVIALSTDPIGMQAKLLAKGFKLTDDLVVFETRQKATTKISLLRQTWQCLNTQYDKVRYQGKAETKREYLKDAYFVLAHQLVNQARNFYRRIKQKRKPLLASGEQTESVLAPAHFAEAVNEVIAHYPGQVCKVLNMYIDAYRVDQEAWQNFRFSEDIPWTAVCITPGVEPVEGYYQLSAYQGTCFLDELVCDHYQKALPDKYFDYMPDIADIELPAQLTPLAQKIMMQAAGRKIVFMGGSIGRQKNLIAWYDLIRRVDPNRWFFVQIGRINRNNLTELDKQALDGIVADYPNNLMIYPDYLTDEREFNQIISLSDIIFAVYRQFKRSSNMLSKAAYFKKPILVSDAYLMGERVRRYKIGLAVKENDVKSIQDGLISLEITPDLANHFEAYRQDFNLEVAGQRLCRFIQAGFSG